MGAAISQLPGKVGDLLFDWAKPELSYMWNCSENVKTFKNEVEKLKNMMEVLQRRLDVAKNKGKDPAELENWMKQANDKISEATKFITEEDESNKTCCDLPFCVNLGTLYHYGKMATEKSSSLLKHQQDGERFKDCAFDPLPTPRNIDLYQRKNLENIETQKLALKQIIEAIEDEMVQIVGITGFGGVGKTTLAKEVSVAPEMKNKFDYIEFITVSRPADTKVIKEKADVAAKRIINKEKVLIILDDVWGELKLDEVGIPCGSAYMNCKILLTSRSKDVCVEMNAKHIIVNPLEEKEAWTLFERVGKTETEWDKELKKVALEIVKECGGLPLFLQAVAKALRNKEIKSWEAVLNRLKAPIHGDVKYKKDEILQLKLSYDYLEDEVAKSCFLLCSMFPEDATMDLERLAHYWFGLGIFDNHDTSIQDVKHIVRVAIETLESSFLLLPEEEEEEEEFKMHDLVRDMAMLITSNADDKFLVESGKGLTEWVPRKDLEIYKKISLMGNKICKLPGHKLLFPQLDTFLLQNNRLSIVPDEFFGGMEQLKVLDMLDNKLSSLPQSLKQLQILRLLDLSYNLSLSEISILGELTCLEILKLRSTGIVKIPEEIGQLINLRLLDVFYCKNLSYVAPGVISKLIRLEELYVGLEEEKVDCKFVLELTELKLLKVLHLQVPGLQHIPEDFPFETLTEFLINFTSQYVYTWGFKRFVVILDFPFPKLIMKLIQLSEMLCLCGIEDLDNILPALNPECFDELKCIVVWGCKDVRSLVKTCEVDAMETKRVFFSQLKQMELGDLDRLEVLWDSPHQYITFSNLRIISINACPSLIKLFPLSVAQGLVNLRDLEIERCERLVGVICGGGGDIEETCGSEIEEETSAAAAGELMSKTELPIVFPHLNYIYLYDLPKLESFYSGHSTIKYPSLKEIELYECRSMKRWSYEDNHMPNLLKPKLQPSYTNINDYIAGAAKEG